MDDIIQKIRDIYGEFDEFEELGYEYVCWIIKQDLKDIEEEDYSEEQILKEFADIMINIIRKLDEERYDPIGVIENRLEDRMEGNGADIVERYTSKYEKERG